MPTAAPVKPSTPKLTPKQNEVYALMKKERPAKEIAAALASENKSDKVTIDMIEAAPSYEARAALIRSFVRQDPARAALVVRDLIRADTAKGA